ncbi:6-carboxytetrahydropterin synthase QueD [Patescibacteria group bacterium]|nr:6-carboxytetrahydropterin synthase QueD [Patescibacteria group bacterium]
MLTITKKFEFAYAHLLPNYEGKCRNLHGHNAVLEVEVSGPPINRQNVYPTMVCDFGDLKGIVDTEIINKLDHKHLNDIMEYPTAETMCQWIWNRLFVVFGKRLERVRIYETSNSYAEVKR